MALELRVLRYSPKTNDTLGILKDELGEFFSYTLEDEKREIKVSGETCIPDGRYKLIIRKELTELTKKHRTNYNIGEVWFEFHIEISGIPGFKYVYVHAGNNEKHTDGCLLVGDEINNNSIEAGRLSKSIQACKRFYKKYYPIIKEGKREVYINFITIK